MLTPVGALQVRIIFFLKVQVPHPVHRVGGKHLKEVVLLSELILDLGLALALALILWI